MKDRIPYVYHIGAIDEYGNCPLSMDRYYAFELAKHYANKRNEPVPISVTINGSAKTICELTIYPDLKEDESC